MALLTEGSRSTSGVTVVKVARWKCGRERGRGASASCAVPLPLPLLEGNLG